MHYLSVSSCILLVALVSGVICGGPNPSPCPNGFVGRCRPGQSCPTGSTCQTAGINFQGWGLCCRDAIVPERQCRFGQQGICGGIGGLQCPTGTYCMDSGQTFPDAAGKCCNIRPQVCPHGQRGICGGIGGIQCPTGTTCRFMQTFPDGAGKCCIDGPKPEPCRFGETGVCGGIAGLPCQRGSTCRFIPTDISDGMGKCCRDGPTPPTGQCPPPSGLSTVCVFDPERNCLGDEYCPAGHLCCSEGCGRVCKPAVRPPVGPIGY